MHKPDASGPGSVSSPAMTAGLGPGYDAILVGIGRVHSTSTSAA